ncbi:hypothetical protein VKT23_020376 [Stygiomarasmius scandens]|uniref:F-box domain-containing protein n=1 Tax=Marasmiellus scandens TaxID=2682957 RepID=A0ABR1ILM6_9AGAR
MGSSFSSLLDHDQASSVADASAIHNWLSNPSKDLDLPDSEIAHLETCLANLRQEHDKVDAHPRLPSAFRLIPPEILAEIFVRCLPKDRNPKYSLSEPPLSLGLVCRDWREVCLSTPRLWSSIHVPFPRSGGMTAMRKTIEGKILGVETWLNRSGSLPLSFSIHADPDCTLPPRSETMDRKQQQEALLLLTGLFTRYFMLHVDRWQDIELGLGASNSDTLQYLEQCPNLLHLKFRDYLVGPWPPGLQCNDFRPILFKHKNLHTCHLDIWVLDHIHTASLASYPAISLSSLIALSLEFTVLGGVGDQVDAMLFHDIFAPALRCLKVSIYNQTSSLRVSQHAPFISLLSGSQIRELETNFQLSVDGYIECLSLAPNLTKLVLNNTPAYKCLYPGHVPEQEMTGKRLMDHLTPSFEQPDPLCPKLRHLSISGFRMLNEQMVNLASSRRGSVFEGVAELETLQVKFSRPRRDSDREDVLDELREQGMKISFEYLQDEE